VATGETATTSMELDPLARETICAVASAVGGAIGVVRVSGPASEAIARRLAPGLPTEVQSHHQYLVPIVEPRTAAVIDQALVCVMRAPRSYTGETVVELQGHGGEANLAGLLAATLAAGARLATPGEFTRRAFLAGRLDLAQAEAVAEVIAARSDRALRVAQAQLGGALSAQVRRLRERCLAALAEVEAGVDFPDERLQPAGPAALEAEVRSTAVAVEELAGTFARGRLLGEGVDCALVGRTNAGKSSLLNALVGEERALVDAAAGTTRDFIEATLEHEGVRLTLVDTAGERSGAAALEERGLVLGRARSARADVVVVVIDGVAGFGEVEARLLEAQRVGAAGPRAVLLAWNKSDLCAVVTGLPSGLEALPTSARTGAGVAGLLAAIRRAAGDVGAEEGLTVTSLRQHDLLAQAGAALDRAAVALAEAAPLELVAVDLGVAVDRLGQIIGEAVGDDVLDRVFARFCIGK